mgnify:CR=1 FL=1
MIISDLIIELHNLARTIEDSEESLRVRLLADELAKIGNRLQEKNLEPENRSRKKFRNSRFRLEK